MTTTQHVATYCPSCHHRLDASTAVDSGPGPKAGDFSLCAYCGETLRFGEKSRLRVATDADLREAPRELTQARKLQRRIAARLYPLRRAPFKDE